jgi:hypothetical protein
LLDPRLVTCLLFYPNFIAVCLEIAGFVVMATTVLTELSQIRPGKAKEQFGIPLHLFFTL